MREGSKRPAHQEDPELNICKKPLRFMQQHHLHHAKKRKKKKKKSLEGNFLCSSLSGTTMRSDETAAAAGYLRWAHLQQREQSLPVFYFFALVKGFQGQRRFLVLLKWNEINYTSPLANKSSVGASSVKVDSKISECLLLNCAGQLSTRQCSLYL